MSEPTMTDQIDTILVAKIPGWQSLGRLRRLQGVTRPLYYAWEDQGQWAVYRDQQDMHHKGEKGERLVGTFEDREAAEAEVLRLMGIQTGIDVGHFQCSKVEGAPTPRMSECFGGTLTWADKIIQLGMGGTRFRVVLIPEEESCGQEEGRHHRHP